MELPICFCWSRFGTEAGETITQILRRKEKERVGNNGVFLWGIGNALGPSVRALLKMTPTPEVVFSPMLSAARTQDVRPDRIVRWHSGIDLDGRKLDLPKASIVTSGMSANHHNRKRYALVCYATGPLVSSAQAGFSIKELSNLVSGNPVGASQVTSIVRYSRKALEGIEKPYKLAFKARLVAPYYLELADGELVDGASRSIKVA